MLKKDKLRYNEYFDMQSIFDVKAEYQISIQKSER